jgi:hypothetical protein
MHGHKTSGRTLPLYFNHLSAVVVAQTSRILLHGTVFYFSDVIIISIIVHCIVGIMELKGTLTNRFVTEDVTADALAQDGQSERALERILFRVDG